MKNTSIMVSTMVLFVTLLIIANAQTVVVEPWDSPQDWLSSRIASVDVSGSGRYTGLSCKLFPVESVRWAIAHAGTNPTASINSKSFVGEIDDYSNTLSFSGQTITAPAEIDMQSIAVVLRPHVKTPEKVEVACTVGTQSSPLTQLTTPTTLLPEYLLTMKPTYTTGDADKTVSLAGTFDGRPVKIDITDKFICTIPGAPDVTYSFKQAGSDPVQFVTATGATFDGSVSVASLKFDSITLPQGTKTDFTIKGVVIQAGGSSRNPILNPTITCQMPTYSFIAVQSIPLPKDSGSITNLFIPQKNSDTDFFTGHLNGGAFPKGLRQFFITINTAGYSWSLPNDWSEMQPKTPDLFLGDVIHSGAFQGENNEKLAFNNIVQDFIPPYTSTVPIWLMNAIVVPTPNNLGKEEVNDHEEIEFTMTFNSPWNLSQTFTLPRGKLDKDTFRSVTMNVQGAVQPKNKGNVDLLFNIDRLGSWEHGIELECKLPSTGELRFIQADTTIPPSFDVSFNGRVNGFSIKGKVSEDQLTMTFPSIQTLSRSQIRLQLKNLSVGLHNKDEAIPQNASITCEDLIQHMFVQPETFVIPVPSPEPTPPTLNIIGKAVNGQGKTESLIYVTPSVTISNIPPSTTNGLIQIHLVDTNTCTQLTVHNPDYMKDGKDNITPQLLVQVGDKTLTCRIVHGGLYMECLAAIPAHNDIIEKVSITSPNLMIIKKADKKDCQSNLTLRLVYQTDDEHIYDTTGTSPTPTLSSDYETKDWTNTIITQITPVVSTQGPDKDYTTMSFQLDGSKKNIPGQQVSIAIKTPGFNFLVHQPTPPSKGNTTIATPHVKINDKDIGKDVKVVMAKDQRLLIIQNLAMTADTYTFTLPNVYVIVNKDITPTPPTVEKIEISVDVLEWDTTRIASINAPTQSQDFKDNGNDDKTKKSHTLRKVIIAFIIIAVIAGIAFGVYAYFKKLFCFAEKDIPLLTAGINDSDYNAF